MPPTQFSGGREGAEYFAGKNIEPAKRAIDISAMIDVSPADAGSICI